MRQRKANEEGGKEGRRGGGEEKNSESKKGGVGFGNMKCDSEEKRMSGVDF